MRHFWFLALLIILLFGCGNSSPEEHMEQYKLAKEKGNVSEAIVHIKSYVSLVPEDAEGRYHLAEAYFTLNEFDNSLKELDKAEEAGKAYDELLELRVLNNYYTQNFEQVIWHVEKLPNLDFQLSPLTTLLTFISKMYQENPRQPIPDSLDGDLREIALKYQSLFLNKNETVSKASFSNSNLAAAEKYWVTSYIQTRNKDYEGAIESLTNFLTIMPQVSLAKFQLIEALIKNGSFDKASETLSLIEKTNPKHVYVSYLRAYINLQSGDLEGALKKSEYALQNGIEVSTAYYVAGVSAFYLDKYESAYRYLERLTNKLPDNSEVKNYLARTKLKLGYLDEAYADLLVMEIQTIEDENLLSVAAALMAEQGKLQFANSLTTKVRMVNPTSENLSREARIKLLLGDGLAIPMLEKAIDKEPSVQENWMLMASAYIKSKEFDKAYALADKWIDEDYAKGVTLKGLIFELENKYSEAEISYREAIKSAPDSYGAYKLLIKMLIKTKEFERAFEVSKRLITRGDDSFTSLSFMLQIGSNPELSADAIQFLTKQAKSNANSDTTKLALAFLNLTLDRTDEASKIISKIKSEDDISIQLLLSDVAIALNNVEKAKEALKNVINVQPLHEIARVKLISILEREGKLNDAEKVVKAGLQLNTDSNRLKITLLGLLVKLKKYAAAEKVFEKSTSKDNLTKVEQSLLYKYEGEVALMKGDFPKAINSYFGHYEIDDSFNSAVLLARSLYISGEAERARIILEDKYSKLDDTSLYWRTMAEFYQATGKLESAIAIYEQNTSKSPHDFLALNNLSILYLDIGKADKAVESAKKAFELAPEAIEIQDTLAQCYLRVGELGKALSIIKSVIDQKPENKAYRLTFAEVLVATGDKITARNLVANISFESNRLKVRHQTVKNEI